MPSDVERQEVSEGLEARPTPGPWAWFGNTKSNLIYLATVAHGRRFVMQFKRWGMDRAQPTFQVKRGGSGVMVPASDLVEFEVGDKKSIGHKTACNDPSIYRYDIAEIAHPDARLIAASPELLQACEEALRITFQVKPKDQPQALIDFESQLREAIARAKGLTP